MSTDFDRMCAQGLMCMENSMGVRRNDTKQKSYIKNLNQSDLELLKAYTNWQYKIINDVSSGDYRIVERGSTQDKTAKRQIHELDNIFLNAPPLLEKITVYRGMSTTLAKRKSRFSEIDSSTVCQEVVSRGRYLSCSLDIDAASENIYLSASDGKNVDVDSYCCLLAITLSPGDKGLYLEDISEYPEEKEVLLHRSTKLTFIGKEEKELELKKPVGGSKYTQSVLVYHFEKCNKIESE